MITSELVHKNQPI